MNSFKKGNQVSWIGNHGNRKNRTIVGTVNENSKNENIKVAVRNYKASNGKPLQTTNEVIHITKTKLRKNQNKENMQLNEQYFAPLNVSVPRNLVRNSPMPLALQYPGNYNPNNIHANAPRSRTNYTKVSIPRSSNSWITQHSTTELKSRINNARNGPKGLVDTGSGRSVKNLAKMFNKKGGKKIYGINNENNTNNANNTNLPNKFTSEIIKKDIKLIKSQKDYILHGLHRSFAGPSGFSNKSYNNIMLEGPYKNGTVIPVSIEQNGYKKYIYIDDASNKEYKMRKVCIIHFDSNGNIYRIDTNIYEE
jgi:hypothetical protein